MKRSFTSIHERNFEAKCEQKFEQKCEMPEYEQLEFELNESRELVPYELEIESAQTQSEEIEEFDYSIVPQGIYYLFYYFIL